MPTLADIYSAIDSAKRKGSDFIRNPGASLQQIAGYGIDRANAARDALYQATEEEGIGFGPKTRALAKQMAESYNPIGIVVGPNSAIFNKVNAFKAQELEKLGKTPQEILEQTGTFRGANRQWQQEIKKTPQEEALFLAQQRATLPIEKGGLGLPPNNTANDRAKAMGGFDAVHFSRKGGDYTELDSGKFAIAPFDAVGTHVGTPQAAMERFQNTVGYKVNNPNYALDELTGSSYPVKVLGDKPLLNQNGMPWGEDDLNNFLRQIGGHNYSDINGGKLTYQDLNAELRKKLFNEQGYTSIPYFNEVEGKGSISHIVPPENIRSRFAAFDPWRKTAAIAATMGVAAPDLLAEEKNKKSTDKNRKSTNPLNYYNVPIKDLLFNK